MSSATPQRGTTLYGCALVTCAALLAAFSFMLSVNEYVAIFGQEMADAYDCDGPQNVMIVAVPAFVLGVAGVVASRRAYRASRGRRAAIAVCVGVAVLCAIATRAPAVVTELRKNSRPGSPCR